MNIDVKMADRVFKSNLPAAAKLIYMNLVYHARVKTREAFPSWETIVSETGIGHDSVHKALKLLVERGFVTKHSTPGRRSKTYRIIDITSPPHRLNSPPHRLLNSATQTLT